MGFFKDLKDAFSGKGVEPTRGPSRSSVDEIEIRKTKEEVERRKAELDAMIVRAKARSAAGYKPMPAFVEPVSTAFPQSGEDRALREGELPTWEERVLVYIEADRFDTTTTEEVNFDGTTMYSYTEYALADVPLTSDDKAELLDAVTQLVSQGYLEVPSSGYTPVLTSKGWDYLDNNLIDLEDDYLE